MQVAENIQKEEVKIRPLKKQKIRVEIPPFETSVNVNIPRELSSPTGRNVEILEKLGESKDFRIYLGKHLPLGRKVAVKLLPIAKKLNELHTLDRFRRIAETMAKLDHPNITTTYEVDVTSQGDSYLLMEYVDGYNLREMIRGGQLNANHIKSWIPQLCSAIDHIHQRGITHGNLRPKSVMVSLDGWIRLTSFAAAEIGGEIATRGSSNSAYSAPEVPDATSPTSDIYSLGAILYGMLVGGSPPVPWRPPSEASTTKIDPRFDKIVAKAMQRDPALRYQSATELAEEVLSIARTEPTLENTMRVLLPVKRDTERKGTHPWDWAWVKTRRWFTGEKARS